MNVQQTCSRLLYPCGLLSMDVTDSGRTWSGQLRKGHDIRQSCWQRVKVVIWTTYTCYSRERLLFAVQSWYRDVYHVLKPILPTTRHGSCRHAHVSTTLRPHPVPADSTTSPICLNMSKTIGEVCRSVRIFPSPSNYITFPTRILNDIHVYSKLRQDLIPFWPVLWVLKGSTWHIVTVWHPPKSVLWTR